MDDLNNIANNVNVNAINEINEISEIYNPYNPSNVEITLNDIQSILIRYNIVPKVNNIELYKRAFVHKSYTNEGNKGDNNIKMCECPANCVKLKTKSNERLEFLGDGVLECITKYYLYKRFPKENERFMTEKKIAIVKNESIGKFAYEMGLHKWLLLSTHAEEKKIRTNLEKLGCLFEAFLGALFLDFNKINIKDEDKWFSNTFVCGPGFQMAQIFVENILEKHVNWVHLIQNDDNYKNILQVKIQKEFKVTPEYIIIQQNTDIGYHMGVYLCLGQKIYNTNINNYSIPIQNYKSLDEIKNHISKNEGKILLLMGEGIHKIKKKSEQIACQNALSIFEEYSTIFK